MFEAIRNWISGRPTESTLAVNGILSGVNTDAGASLVMLSRKGDSAPVATATVTSSGSFRVDTLPASLRGQSLVVSIVDSSGRSAELFDFSVPQTGDANVTGRRDVRNDFGRLQASELEGLIEQTKVRNDAFRQARGNLGDVREPQPDWQSARKLVASWQNLRFAQPKLRIPPENLATWNRKSIFRRPSSGFDKNSPKIARLLMTNSQAQDLGASPTLCQAVLATDRSRGFERKGRLVDRFRRRRRLDSISLPPSDGASPPDNQAEEQTIEQLEEQVDKAVLTRAAAVISDLRSAEQPRPTTAEDLLRLRRIAEELELSQGTTNVAAAREVHSLQIAFLQETSPNDDYDLLGKLAELSALKLSIEADYGTTLPKPGSNSRDAFVEHLALVKQKLRTEFAIEPIPKGVRKHMPKIDAMTWARLDDDAKAIVIEHVNDLGK